MAAQFIGLTILVTLKSPPGAQLQGLVDGVNAGELTLRNVYFPQNGYRMPEYRIAGAQIEDLEVAPTADPQPETFHEPSQTLPGPAAASSVRKREQFTDPAILSVGPKPAKVGHETFRNDPRPQQHAALASVEAPHAPPVPSTHVQGPFRPADTHASSAASQRTAHASTSATLTAPFTETSFKGGPEALEHRAQVEGKGGSEQVEVGVTRDGQGGRRTRRGGKGKGRKDAAIQTPSTTVAPADDVEYASITTKKKGSGEMGGTAFRDSALLEVRGEQAIGRRGAASQRKSRRQRPMKPEDYDGWATEEATDIQGLGEFDFAGNLSKFDKKSVFSQIRADDTTADESRLVSFNRLQSRGRTGGGESNATKKLHHTENVLDHRDHMVKWNSEAGVSSDDGGSDLGFGSGRNSARAMSRQSTRQQPSRKGSAIAASNSNLSQSVHLASSASRAQHSSSIGASPNLGKYSPSGSPRPVTKLSSTSAKPSLRHILSNRVCPVVSPLQMLDVERIAEVELGLTEDMMTENAARCIAEVALLALNPGGKRLERENHNPLPVVVILAGNNKSGARAVAGGRHLRNHGVRVIVCVLGLEREEEMLDSMRRQLHVFRSIGGRLTRWPELAATLKSFDAPAELVIDGLLGMHVAFEDLRNDDQLTAYELISWANSSKANILAVDVPTGMDASTGEVSMLDDQQLQLRARFIVAMGAPKSGLLNAMIRGEGQSWQIFVADIGISNTAWRKYGTRRRHGVEFSSDWVVGLRYQSGVE